MRSLVWEEVNLALPSATPGRERETSQAGLRAMACQAGAASARTITTRKRSSMPCNVRRGLTRQTGIKATNSSEQEEELCGPGTPPSDARWHRFGRPHHPSLLY
jgi:hypothetical protein